MEVLEIKPPNPLPKPKDFRRILFLAGSIEMGVAENWQDKVVKAFSDEDSKNSLCILNPRRDSWNSSWIQSISNPEFKAQVEWELKGLEMATHILFYFDPITKSPISLLELGLHAMSGKCCVICPDGFYRKGNVDILCERYNIPLGNNLDEALKTLL